VIQGHFKANVHDERSLGMSSLKPSARLGRLLRQDVWENLGRPTQEQVCDAIDEGRLEEAKLLARYMVPENKALHDFFCDLIWNILSEVANRHGEEEMADILKKSQETWMMKRTWKGFLTLPVEERVQITAEIMRSHRCGPKQDGTIQVTEDEDRYSIIMDPCGSGGRMRRGDPFERTPSRLGPPYNFGATKAARNWNWNKKGVGYYCIHCVFNEILPMEWGAATPSGLQTTLTIQTSRAFGTSTKQRRRYRRSITPGSDAKNRVPGKGSIDLHGVIF
jgi:hypothetical protein